jgi:hypothetical protein
VRSKWLLIAMGALVSLILAGILVEARCAVPAQPPAAITHDDLPDHTITPGVVDPNVTQADIRSTICTGGYTKSVRPPRSYTDRIKRQQMREYGRKGPIGDYSEDHLIPLNLGGSPDDRGNLWPEPRTTYWSAQRKDDLEFYMYTRVCRGDLSLEQARGDIAANWIDAYRRYKPSQTHQTED